MEHTFDSVLWTDTEEYYGSYRLDMRIATRRYDGVLSFTVSMNNHNMYEVTWNVNVFALRGPQDFDTEGNNIVRSKADALKYMEAVVEKLKMAHGGTFSIPFDENYIPESDSINYDDDDEFYGFKF